MRRIVSKSIPGISAMALVLAVVAGSTAIASTVLRFSTNDLADRAKVVVHGKVVSKTPRKLGKGVIVTNVQIKVTKTLKGADQVKDGVFSFSAYGGVIGKRGSGISGAASYDKGEEVLVFLTGENKIGCRAAIGLAQGKYTIRTVKGKKLAFRDLEGLRLMDTKKGTIEEAKAEQGIPFETLLGSVTKRIAETKKKTERK